MDFHILIICPLFGWHAICLPQDYENELVANNGFNEEYQICALSDVLESVIMVLLPIFLLLMYLCLYLKWVSWRWYILWPCFFIQSENLWSVQIIWFNLTMNMIGFKSIVLFVFFFPFVLSSFNFLYALFYTSILSLLLAYRIYFCVWFCGFHSRVCNFYF